MIREGRLVIQDRVEAEERLVCLDAVTGEERWDQPFPTDYQCKYAYSNGPYATPTLTPEAIYAVYRGRRCRGGDVRSPASRSGSRRLLKETNAKVGAFGVGISPRLWQDRLILNIGGKDGQGIVAALGRDRRNALVGGRLRPRLRDGDRRPAARTGFRLRPDRTRARLLDPNDGRIHWMYPFGIQASAERGQRRLADRRRQPRRDLLRPGPRHRGPRHPAGLDRTKLVWKNQRVVDGQYTNLLELDGCLYGVTARRLAMLRCADLKTGQLLWEHESDLCRANTLFVDGHVLVLGEHGHLGCLRPGTREAHSLPDDRRAGPQHPCYSTMALWEGRLCVRNEKEVVCLDLRMPSHPTFGSMAVTKTER